VTFWCAATNFFWNGVKENGGNACCQSAANNAHYNFASDECVVALFQFVKISQAVTDCCQLNSGLSSLVATMKPNTQEKNHEDFDR
jgi:hypothetical protein